MKSWVIDSERNKSIALTAVAAIATDGKLAVKIIGSGSKSTRQRGLQWRLYTEIAALGIGGEHGDTKDGVHLTCKYKFAKPILTRDSGYFRYMWSGLTAVSASLPPEKHKEYFHYLVDEHISTEKFTTSQMAEYLTDIYQYYAGKGIYLEHPEDRGLLELER